MERQMQIEDLLAERGYTAEEDLRRLDTNKLRKENIFLDAEVVKLEEYIKISELLIYKMSLK